MRPGFGNMLQGMAGFNEMIGWPDRGPSSVSTTYPDWLVPYFGATALIAALMHKQRTGEGQYIDLSQFESALQFLGAAFLDGTVNHRVEGQVGNDLTAGGVRYVAPHGVYRCQSAAGERFVALAALDDEQWMRIVDLSAVPALADGRFATNATRCEHAREIDDLLETWTSTREAGLLVEQLTAMGVPAGVVQTPADLDDHPQLAYRRHFVPVPHGEIGEIVVDMPGARLSETPAAPVKAGPCIGEDNERVYQELLGYSEDEYYEMLALGVVELWEHE
jgi:crotonobetainyl-CoA:carnitine CoA-transferase CaiB-like acyl-CoA transferase